MLNFGRTGVKKLPAAKGLSSMTVSLINAKYIKDFYSPKTF